MGQRLIVNVVDENQEIIANSYYHWGAYTGAALEIVEEAIKNFHTIKEDNSKIEAIKFLELTGAGFSNENLHKLKQYYPNKEFKVLVDRNAGILEFEEKGINENMDWAEGIVSVNLKERVIDISGVLSYHENNELDLDIVEIADITFDELGIDIARLGFDEFPKKKEKLMEALSTGEIYRSDKEDIYIGDIC